MGCRLRTADAHRTLTLSPNPHPKPSPSPSPSPSPHPNPDAKPKPNPKPNLTAGRLPQLSDERVHPAGQYKTPALGRAPGPLDCLLAPGPKWAPGPLDAREASLRAAPPVDTLPSLYVRAHHGSLRPARRADRERFCLWPCTLQARLADAERQVQHALRDRARPVPRRRRRQGQGALNCGLSTMKDDQLSWSMRSTPPTVRGILYPLRRCPVTCQSTGR